jgi:hypothetical protein
VQTCPPQLTAKTQTVLQCAFADEVQTRLMLPGCSPELLRKRLVDLIVFTERCSTRIAKYCSVWLWVVRFQPGSDSSVPLYQWTHFVLCSNFLQNSHLLRIMLSCSERKNLRGRRFPSEDTRNGCRSRASAPTARAWKISSYVMKSAWKSLETAWKNRGSRRANTHVLLASIHAKRAGGNLTLWLPT